jgi:hypothetical protein
MLKIAGVVLAASVVLASSARGEDLLSMPLLTLAQGPRTIVATVPEPPARAPATRPAAAPASVRDLDARVTIEPSGDVTYVPGSELHTGIERWLNDPSALPSTQAREEVEMIRSALPSETGFFDALGNVFDMPEDDIRPWSRTTAVHLLAGEQKIGEWVPFAAFAREEGALQDQERIGVGGGMSYYVAPHASVNTEMLYFGDRGNSNNAWERETRFSLRFQWEF